MSSSSAELLYDLARQQHEKSGNLSYNSGKNDILKELTDSSRFKSLSKEHEYILRNIIQQPSALYCGGPSKNGGTRVSCCFACIVKQPKEQWIQACDELIAKLHNRLTMNIAEENMSYEKVLDSIKAEGMRTQPSAEWKDSFEWLEQALACIYEGTNAKPPENHADIVTYVEEAATIFKKWNGSVPLRPCQLAAILLNVYGVKTGTKLLIEMKTGEGKTFVCGISAAIVAKNFNKGPAIILTSSLDRANDDKKSTEVLIKKILGEGKGPITVKELKPGRNNGEGCVAYGQVSDIQRIVVEMLTQSNTKGLDNFLATCSFFLDEADHVLVEQAESLLYIASPCPAYYALHSLFFHIQFHLDYGGDYKCEQVKTRTAIPEKAKKLTKKLLDVFTDYEYSHKDYAPLHPKIIDLDVFVAATVSGALSARFKANGKEFIIDTTSETDHSGAIAGVPRITIVDMATGNESDGTRWTTEAPNLEAMQGLPIGGSDPLAYYSAFPYLLRKAKWFGGITGTVGAAHTLKYYGETFDIWSTFRIPRNKVATIFRQPTIIAESEEKQIQSICDSIEKWMNENSDKRAKGPILVIAESITKAMDIEKALKLRGHPIMEAIMMEKATVKWKEKGSNNITKNVAHVFPYYRRDHAVMEKFPDWAIIVASNKGGRGLDLKLDHDKCPEYENSAKCRHKHHIRANTRFESVLFVILTDVLPGRQDEQAVGRCGRSGRAGVVQYHLVRKEMSDIKPGDPEITYLHRKISKDAIEERDLSSKTNRIGQHQYDGFVLDRFCANLPTYVDEWILKLFPVLINAPKTADVLNASNVSIAICDLTDDESILVLQPIVRKWLTDYVIQAWAYWRGYGGYRRQPGDNRKHFEIRMGLAAAIDLPISKKQDALQRFADRFWRFACIMRLSGEALYTFAKALLASKNGLHLVGFCLDILDKASNAVFEVEDVYLTLPPDGTKWQSEFSGNAALLFARLSEDPEEGLRRAIKAIDIAIARYECDSSMKKQPYPLNIPKRENKTYYLTQRAEIVQQLQERKRVLESLIGKFPLDLKHFSTALKDHNVAFHAYCLGYGFCEVMFEWYVGRPFSEMEDKTKVWGDILTKRATDLGASPIYTQAGGSSGGGGATEVKTEEQLNKFEKEGANIMERLNNTAATPTYKWTPSEPTKSDIEASRQTIWQVVVGMLSTVWEWIVTIMTGPVQKYKAQSSTTDMKLQRQLTEDYLKQTPIWESVRSHLKAKAANQGSITGGLVEYYLGADAKAIVDIVDELGTFQRQTDLMQEEVEIRQDGATARSMTRDEAMSKAKQEAKDQVHLRDDSLSKEDVHIIGETLKALKELSSEQKLEGFDDQMLRLLEAMSQYNEFAMEAKVNPETAKKMNEAMKMLWKSTLEFALEHGRKIKGLGTALDNYYWAKMESSAIEVEKKVVTTATYTIKKVVSVVQEVVEYAWDWVKWIWSKVKKVVKKVVEVVQEIPIIREVVTFVKEKVVNPAYEAAKNFFKSATETLASVISKIGGSNTVSAITEAIRIAFEKIGQMASKAWNWFTQKMVQVWELLKRVLIFTLSFLVRVILVIGYFLKSPLSYLRYKWQGSGEIMMSYVWGTEFDVLDVQRNPNRVSRYRMRMREALSRVWAASWIQWWLDPSIRLGLDLDPREYVQSQQERAHDSFLRRERTLQQQRALKFAVIGVLISILFVIAAIFTGGPLILAVVGLVCSLLSALLQYASINLDADRSINEERKKTIQNYISIAQSIILIGSFGFGLLHEVGLIAEIAIIVGTTMRYIGTYLNKISAWLQKISDTLRIEQKAKGTLQQIDKIFSMLGLGSASVFLLNIHKSLAGMISTLLEVAGSLLQLIQMRIGNIKEQNQQEAQQQEHQEDEEDDNKDEKDYMATLVERKFTRNVERVDGWTLQKICYSVGASINDKSGNFEICHEGMAPTYCFTPKNGEPIHVSFAFNEKTSKMEPVFKNSLGDIRELSKEELAFFEFGDIEPSADQLDKLFQKDKAEDILSDTTRDVKIRTYFNKDGVEIKRVKTVTTENGEVSEAHVKSKMMLVTLRPNDDSKPGPMYYDVQSNVISKRIRGEVTDKHLKLWAKHLGADIEAVEQLIAKDLANLVTLAKNNQTESTQQTVEEKSVCSATRAIDENNKLVERMMVALLPRETNRTVQVREEERSLLLEEQLTKAIFEASHKHSVSDGADTDRAMDDLLAHFHGYQNYTITKNHIFHNAIKEQGTAKALFDWLSNIASQKVSKYWLTPNPENTNTMKSKGEVLYEMFKKSGAGYSRRYMKFNPPPYFDRDRVADIIKRLAEKQTGSLNNIQQVNSSTQIQVNIEKFIRDRDQQGLIDYVQRFCLKPMPDEFKSIPGMEDKWKAAKRLENADIADELVQLIDRAWGQNTDHSVTASTTNLVEIMSNSVSNLWIESTANPTIDKKIFNSKHLEILNYESPYLLEILKNKEKVSMSEFEAMLKDFNIKPFAKLDKYENVEEKAAHLFTTDLIYDEFKIAQVENNAKKLEKFGPLIRALRDFVSNRKVKVEDSDLILWRGCQFDSNQLQDWKNASGCVGKYVTFGSFSSSKEVALQFSPKILVKLVVKEGSNINAASLREFSQYPQESEFLLAPETTFKIIRSYFDEECKVEVLEIECNNHTKSSVNFIASKKSVNLGKIIAQNE